MLDNNPDVAALLERVLSQAPHPERNHARSNSEEIKRSATRSPEEAQPWWLPGICGQTAVTTNFGQVPAQLLRVGDRVRTRSGRYLKIRHIRETKLDHQFVHGRPDARPVLIPKGSLSRGLPEQDLLLSPAQPITLVAGSNDTRVLRARDLSRGTQAVDKTVGMVAYYELQLEAEDEVCCHGVWVKATGTQ